MRPHRLYLVRHGRAEEERGQGDPARRLTAEGRSRFRALLVSLGPRLEVSRIVTSPLARARETADLLSAATGAPVQEDDALSSGRSSAREILDLARAGEPGLALVGHNPELAAAVALVAGRDEKVRPGTIAAIDLREGEASLAWLEAPSRE